MPSKIIRMAAAPSERIAREIEARYRDDRPDLYASLRDGVRLVHRTRFARICDWLGNTFGESPRGFAFFAGLLLPICVTMFCVTMFCVGYFGLRELLAVVLS